MAKRADEDHAFLVPPGVSNNLYLASLGGYAHVQDGKKTSAKNALEYLGFSNKIRDRHGHVTDFELASLVDSTAGVSNPRWTSMHRSAIIVIANGLTDALVETEMYATDTTYPVWWPVAPKGIEKMPGADKNNVFIPGLFALPNDDGSVTEHTGVGIYAFTNAVRAFEGAGGAISFKSDDPNLPGEMALAFQVPLRGQPSFWFAEDWKQELNADVKNVSAMGLLPGGHTDLALFYNSTVGENKSHLGHLGKSLKSMVHVSAVDLTDGDTNCMLYMVSIVPVKKQQRLYDFLWERCKAKLESDKTPSAQASIQSVLFGHEDTVSPILAQAKSSGLFATGAPKSVPKTHREYISSVVHQIPNSKNGQRFNHRNFKDVPQGHAQHSYRVIDDELKYFSWWAKD